MMWVVRCILFLAVMGYSFSQVRGLDNNLDGEALTKTVTVEFPELRKAVADKCDMPRHLLVYIKIQAETVSIQLTRSVVKNVPVYVWRTTSEGTREIVVENFVDGKTSVLYQGEPNAEFEVTCERNGQYSSNLTLDGSLELGGHMYNLTKSKFGDHYTLEEEKVDPSKLGKAVDNEDESSENK